MTAAGRRIYCLDTLLFFLGRRLPPEKKRAPTATFAGDGAGLEKSERPQCNASVRSPQLESRQRRRETPHGFKHSSSFPARREAPKKSDEVRARQKGQRPPACRRGLPDGPEGGEKSRLRGCHATGDKTATAG